MLLNEGIKRGGFVKSALSRNMLAGVVVAEETEVPSPNDSLFDHDEPIGERPGC